MRTYILIFVTIAVSGNAPAKDIPTLAIPVAQIENCLPKEWHIASIEPANSVLGWTRLNGSKGIRIEISRTPYDDKWRTAESGEVAMPIPRFNIDVFPADFEGKSINTSAIFRQGKITPSSPPLPDDPTLPTTVEFSRIGDWYVFYRSIGFRDWKSPATDILQAIQNAPFLKSMPDMRTARVPTQKAALDVLLKKIISESEDGFPATYKPSVKLAFTLGWDMPEFGKQGDRVWQIHLIEFSGPTMRIAWVDAENENIIFLFDKESSFPAP